MSILRSLVESLRGGAIEVDRPDRAAVGADADPPAARRRSARHARVRAARRSAATTTAARPGTGTTSAPASTPAPTSTRRSTGSPARTATDVAQVPGRPADRARPWCSTSAPRRAATRTSCSRSTHVKAWEAEHGPLPDGGWLLYRTGWDARSDDQDDVPQRQRDRPAHARASRVECARWLAEESPVIGVGVETVGTDAGAAHSFDPPFPCHSFLLGSGKYGLTQLQNLGRAAADRRGASSPAPLPIVGGSGSPAGCWRWSSG